MSEIRNFILNEHGEPVPERDFLKWAQWFETADRSVAHHATARVRVSTVFLGLDHAHLGAGLPILWETMIFGGPFDQYQARYTSREAAVAGHAYACALAFNGRGQWRGMLPQGEASRRRIEHARNARDKWYWRRLKLRVKRDGKRSARRGA